MSNQPSPQPEKHSWLLERLDSLLSEPLRKASPSDLVRHRILVGAASFLFLLNTLFVVWTIRLSQPAVPGMIVGLCYLGVLVLARRARTSTAPAMLLLVTV